MTPCYYCEADDDACKTCIHSDTYIDPQEEITKLREQVAAQAAVIEFQKKALKKCEEVIDIVWVSHHANRCDDALDYAREALSIPTDSTQMLDEVRRAEREKCAKVCEAIYTNGDGAEGWLEIAANRIRAME